MKQQFYSVIWNRKNISAVLLLSLTVCSMNCIAQAVGDFRSVASVSHNWSDTLSWQTWNGTAWVAASTIPGTAAAANVTIADSDTINIDVTPANSIATLTMGQGVSGILNFNIVNINITMTGATVISNGAQLNFDTTTTGTRSFTDVTVNTGGTWNNVGNSTATFKGNLTNNGVFNAGTAVNRFTGAAKTITGALTIPRVTITGTYTNNNMLTVATALAGAGTITNGANATLNIGGTSTITTLNCIANTPNLVVYNGVAAQTVKLTSYYNLVINTTVGTASLAAGTATIVLDSLTIGLASTLNLNGDSLACSGPIFNNGILTATAVGSTLVLQGTSMQTVGGTITTNQISSLVVKDTAGAIITPAVQINRSIQLTSGMLSCGGTITLGSAATNPFTYIRSDGNIATTFVTNYGTGANAFTYSGTLAAQTTGLELPAAATTLTINNINGVTLSVPLSTTTLNLTSGVLTATSPDTISVTGTTVASITGGSATAYVKGPLKRAFPAVLTGGTFLFPVGKSTYNLFELVNPTTTVAGTVVVEDFEANSGGVPAPGLTTLDTTRYWTTTLSSNFFSAAAVRLTENPLGTDNAVAQSATLNGTYLNVGGSIVGSTVLSSGVVPSLGYFVLATAGSLSGGTYPVGASSPLPKLTNVASILNTMTLTGNVVFEMQSDYDGTTGETFPIVFSQFITTGGNWSATIRPAAGVTMRTTSGDAGTGNSLISLNGVDRLIFDGRAGSTGPIDWIFRNTRTATTVGSTFNFVNDAISNTLTYLQIEGQDITATSGTIYFNTSTGTMGNDSNTVSFCNIRDRSDVAGIPANAIYSHGTAGVENSANNIINNNIFNFSADGVYVPATAAQGGSGSWTISANNFYNSGTPTTAQIGINLIPGNFPGNGNNTITGNFVGGSAPACGGTAWTNSGNLAFSGISVTVDTTVSTSVQGNTVQNVTKTGVGGSSFNGILINGGKVNVGTITGNAIGSTTVANSVQVAGTGNTKGISATPAPATSPLMIANNTIANLAATGTSASIMAGIWVASGINTIMGNTVFNLSAGNSNTATGAAGSASVLGITETSTQAGQTISQNIIYSLSNSNATIAVRIIGINYSGSATGVNNISRNFIHNFSEMSTSDTAMQVGINAISGVTTYSNNMIALGLNASGASQIITPIIVGIDKASVNNMKFFYNSVYLGGNGVDTNAVNTFAFRRTASPAAINDSIYNNIFMNARSNATTGGKHYSLYLNNTTDFVSDHNVLYTTGTGGMLASSATVDYSTLNLWQTASTFDNNSVSADPAYKVPAGASATTDLHINPFIISAAESRAMQMSIVDDYDTLGSRTGPYPLSGQLNGGGLQPDAGADEGDFKLLITTIANISNANVVSLFPNPAHDQLTVKGKFETGATLIIYNDLGAEMLRETITGDNRYTFDISNLTEGVYFVRIQSVNSSFIGKFVKN